jgi:hypothetical protein
MTLEKHAHAGNTQIEVFVKINVPFMFFVFWCPVSAEALQ